MLSPLENSFVRYTILKTLHEESVNGKLARLGLSDAIPAHIELLAMRLGDTYQSLEYDT